MVQRTHKWCSVMSNSFAEHQTLYLNIKLLSITWNISMLWRIVVAWREGHAIPLLAMLSCSWSLSHLCICWSIRHPCIFGGDGRQGISPKPPKIQTANGTVICWGHDVIECEDCRETVTWCKSLTSPCRKAEPIRWVSPFFPADIAFIRCRSWKR